MPCEFIPVAHNAEEQRAVLQSFVEAMDTLAGRFNIKMSEVVNLMNPIGDAARAVLKEDK